MGLASGKYQIDFLVLPFFIFPSKGVILSNDYIVEPDMSNPYMIAFMNKNDAVRAGKLWVKLAGIVNEIPRYVYEELIRTNITKEFVVKSRKSRKLSWIVPNDAFKGKFMIRTFEDKPAVLLILPSPFEELDLNETDIFMDTIYTEKESFEKKGTGYDAE